MEIEEQVFGDVTVLDLKGKITLSEGGELLRHAIDTLIAAGRTKIVLNLAGVPFVDSSGLGEFVRTRTSVTRRGGKLVLCALTNRIENLLSGPTKLMTTFDVGSTIEEALRLFDPSGLEVSCPVCPAGSWVPLPRGSAIYQYLICPTCLTYLGLGAAQASASVERNDPEIRKVVTYLSLPTYQWEYVQLAAERPFQIQMYGRLDLFSSEVLEKAWRLIPSPRRVVFSMGWGRTEFTEKGLARMLDLCAWTDDDRAVFETGEWLSPEFKSALPNDRRVQESSTSAIEALGDVAHHSSISVTIRKSPA